MNNFILIVVIFAGMAICQDMTQESLIEFSDKNN